MLFTAADGHDLLSQSAYGLVARETVAIDGPEGARGRGGPYRAGRGGGVSGRATSEALPAGAPSIDELLAEAVAGCRLRAEAALAAVTDGAVIIDIRPLETRIVEGGYLARSSSAATCSRRALTARRGSIPALARSDARLIVMCSEGYASTLAAASLRPRPAGCDLSRGRIQAWKAADLPTRPPSRWAERGRIRGRTRYRGRCAGPRM